MTKPAETIDHINVAPMSEFITCESTAAIVLHARRIGISPVTLSGHSAPRPITLCGTEAAWDTRLPLTAVKCRKCIEVLSQRKTTT